MLSDQLPMQFGNFIYFVMRKWSDCRVCWLTKDPIDNPAMWLSEDAWESVRASHRRPEVRLETAAWRVFPAAIAAFGNEPSPLPRALWTAPNKVDAEPDPTLIICRLPFGAKARLARAAGPARVPKIRFVDSTSRNLF